MGVNDAEGINDMLDFCLRELPQNDFLDSLNEWFEERGTLTKKQYEALCEIYWRHRGD